MKIAAVLIKAVKMMSSRGRENKKTSNINQSAVFRDYVLKSRTDKLAWKQQRCDNRISFVIPLVIQVF